MVISRQQPSALSLIKSEPVEVNWSESNASKRGSFNSKASRLMVRVIFARLSGIKLLIVGNSRNSSVSNRMVLVMIVVVRITQQAMVVVQIILMTMVVGPIILQTFRVGQILRAVILYVVQLTIAPKRVI